MKEENIKLITWLSKNCLPHPQGLVHINGLWDFYWCMRKHTEENWGGIEDDTLKWYTQKEILEMYEKENVLAVTPK